jgi:hypothetical protein
MRALFLLIALAAGAAGRPNVLFIAIDDMNDWPHLALTTHGALNEWTNLAVGEPSAKHIEEFAKQLPTQNLALASAGKPKQKAKKR